MTNIYRSERQNSQDRLNCLRMLSVRNGRCYRFVGAHNLVAAQSKAAKESALEDLPTVQADSELVQHLRRLTKRDATTRVKALQVWQLPSLLAL